MKFLSAKFWKASTVDFVYLVLLYFLLTGAIIIVTSSSQEFLASPVFAMSSAELFENTGELFYAEQLANELKNKLYIIFITGMLIFYLLTSLLQGLSWTITRDMPFSKNYLFVFSKINAVITSVFAALLLVINFITKPEIFAPIFWCLLIIYISMSQLAYCLFRQRKTIKENLDFVLQKLIERFWWIILVFVLSLLAVLIIPVIVLVLLYGVLPIGIITLIEGVILAVMWTYSKTVLLEVAE